MKKLPIISAFILMIFSFTFAQSLIEEVEKARQIKLLEDDWEDVKRIFGDKTLDYGEFSNPRLINTNNASFRFIYSKGKCFEKEFEDGESEEWNVEKGKVKTILIEFKDAILDLEDIESDFSKFRKERWYRNIKNSYVYYDKDSGIGLYFKYGGVTDIAIVPSKKNYSLLCEDKDAKNYYQSKNWFGNSKLKNRIFHQISTPANVTDLILSQTELSARTGDDAKIEVNTIAKDNENDVLVYNYTVSGGKIIGLGAKVIWDLSGEKAGTYMIKVGVDDGCGICGKWMSKTVVVKECPDCPQK